MLSSLFLPDLHLASFIYSCFLHAIYMSTLSYCSRFHYFNNRCPPAQATAFTQDLTTTTYSRHVPSVLIPDAPSTAGLQHRQLASTGIPRKVYLAYVISVPVTCLVVAQRVGRGIALLFYDHGTRRGWVVSVTPRPYFTPGKEPVPIVQESGWAPGPVWTGGKSRPTGIRSPDRPARSQSLYRLSYRPTCLRIR